MNKDIFLVKVASFLGGFYTHKILKQYPIGKYTYGKPKVLYGGTAKLKIGNYTSFAKGVTIFLGGNHNIDWVTTYPFPEESIKNSVTSKGDVLIGNDVWIGRGATILSGLSIGDGAIIGANSVVTKKVDPYSVVAGNPARHIKYRFSEEIISELLSIKWWNWNNAKVLKNSTLLCSPNIQEFIKMHKKT